jgi:hypothetical protein
VIDGRATNAGKLIINICPKGMWGISIIAGASSAPPAPHLLGQAALHVVQQVGFGSRRRSLRQKRLGQVQAPTVLRHHFTDVREQGRFGVPGVDCAMAQRRCPFCGTMRAKSRPRCSSKSTVRSRARRCCTAVTDACSWRVAMYTKEALRLRRCTAATKSGRPCRAFACWDDAAGRCVSHSGRHHVGPMPQSAGLSSTTTRRRRTGPTCRCPAYQFSHRAGAGLCCWPQQPVVTSPTPPSTHAWPRRRRPSWWSRLR